MGIIDAYGLQFPFFLTSTVGFTLISALAKTHIFIRLNTILLLSNLVADVTLMRYLGLQGLALATSIVYAISLLSLNTYLWKEGTVRPDTHSVTGAVLALASLTMALVLVRLFDMKLTPSSGVMAYVKGLVLLGTVVAAGLLYNWQRIMTYWRARQSI